MNKSVKTLPVFKSFLTTSINDHEKRISQTVESEIITDADLSAAERAVKREQHHLTRKTKIRGLTDETMTKALAFFQSAQRDFSGYDLDKVRTLSIALEANDTDKLNSGLEKALYCLAKIEQKSGQKQSISVTEIARHHAHKNNVRTSFTLLDKLGMIAQEKDGRAVTGYRLNWSAPLVSLLALYK